MRRALMVALLFIVPAIMGCGSSSDFDIPNELAYAGPGTDLGVELAEVEVNQFNGQDITLAFDVTNQTRNDMTIDSITVRPMSDEVRYVIDSRSVRPNHLLSDGQTERFRIQTQGRMARNIRDARDAGRPSTVISLLVRLLDGRTFQAEFGFVVPIDRPGR